MSDSLEIWVGDKPGVSKTMDPVFEALDTLFAGGPSPRSSANARQNLAARLSEEHKAVYLGELDDEVIGKVWVAVTDAGLAGINFGGSKRAFESRMSKETGSRPIWASDRTARAAKQLLRYLSGGGKMFDLSLDLSRLTDFQCRVLLATSRVPYGQLATYSEIAKRIGRPSASRAVGQALAKNPIPIVIPCHRVVASDGSLTGYSGGKGVQTKAQLLKLEGALLE
jgi:methylated-DNA-[protein]-cysteine S-methyltransferase